MRCVAQALTKDAVPTLNSSYLTIKACHGHSAEEIGSGSLWQGRGYTGTEGNNNGDERRLGYPPTITAVHVCMRYKYHGCRPKLSLGIRWRPWA